MATAELGILTSHKSITTRLQKWLPWIGKGSLAIADQGLFASSNFLLNVLLARWLSPAEYGAFALAYSVFLLFLVFHTALLTSPMLVFGSGKYRDRFPEYLGILLRGHFALMIPVAALLVVAAFLLGRIFSLEVQRAFLALAVAAPCILLLWLLRRAFYVRLDPRWAAIGGGTQIVILLASALLLRAFGCLTPSTGFLAMAAASIFTSLILLSRLSPTLSTDSCSALAVAADHWRFGKWIAASAAPAWVTDNIYYVVLPAWLGLAEAGGLKALMNLAQPALQTIFALSVLLLPVLVRDRDSGDPVAMKRTVKLALGLFLVGSAGYLALLWVFRFKIFHFLYAGKYAAYAAWPLLLAGLLPLAQSLPCIAGNALAALERPDLLFWSSVVGSGVTLAVGIPVTLRVGAGGAAAGIMFAYTITGITTVIFFVRTMCRRAG